MNERPGAPEQQPDDLHTHAEDAPVHDRLHAAHDHAHGEHDDHNDQAHDHDEHDHDGHAHDHGEHDHEHGGGLSGLFGELFHSHSHSASRTDRALESSERGIWALKISLAGLLATAIFQVVIVLISGSAALLADTIHNF